MAKKVKLIIGSRAFYPRSAFLMTTCQQAKLAQKMGYGGVQIQPTWRVCGEILTKGQFTLEKEMIGSVERDWRLDRVVEAQLKGKPWWRYQLRNKEDWLFPPSGFCLKILKRIQKVYSIPITTRWYQDTPNFSPVRLELWSIGGGIDHQGLVKWLKKGKGKNLVALDTAKWINWLKSNHLLGKEKQAMEQILPYVDEVHYRCKGKYSRRIDVKATLGDDSHQVLRKVLKRGYRGKVITEFGWPDIDRPEVSWLSPQWQKLDRFHQELKEDIVSLLKPVFQFFPEEFMRRLFSFFSISFPLSLLSPKEQGLKLSHFAHDRELFRKGLPERIPISAPGAEKYG